TSFIDQHGKAHPASTAIFHWAHTRRRRIPEQFHHGAPGAYCGNQGTYATSGGAPVKYKGVLLLVILAIFATRSKAQQTSCTIVVYQMSAHTATYTKAYYNTY